MKDIRKKLNLFGALSRGNSRLHDKLIRSHLTVAAWGAVILIVGLVSTIVLRSSAVRLAEVRGPTVRAIVLVLSGVEQSLASLRGWITLGEQRFADDRVKAWEDDINPGLAELQSLSGKWNSKMDRERLTKLASSLANLELAQQRIVDIAQTQANEPARTILTSSIGPVSDLILDTAYELVEEEVLQDAARERALVSSMLNFRSHFEKSRRSLIDFVSDGESKDESDYQASLQTAKRALSAVVASRAALNVNQSQALVEILEELPTFESLAGQAIALRKSGEWNVARYLLRKDIDPLTQGVIGVLTALSEHQNQLMAQDAKGVTRTSNQTVSLLVGLIVLVAAISLILSDLAARRISEPIRTLSVAAKELGEDQLTEDIAVIDDDELGDLTTSFNEMRQTLQQKKEDMLQLNTDLERSNKELEQFAYVASHDLQEPLRKIASFSELIKEECQGKLSVDADRYIGYTIDGAQRMTRMINDLLLYSRVGQTKLSLDPTSFDTVIKDVTSDLEGAIERNHAKVTVEKMPTVPAHRGQMTQLIQNLIGNALKYRGERDPEVRINVKKTQDALARSSVTAPVKDNVWLFSVEDNGIGIDEKHFEKVFTIFQRLHTKQEYSGSGIGLAICKKIVERHGGRIWLNSQVGTGSTFYFTLPTREAA